MRDILAILRLFWRANYWRFLAGIASATLTLLAGIALLGLSGWFATFGGH